MPFDLRAMFARRKARQRAARGLRVRQDWFRVFVAGISDYAIVMLDTDGLIRSWNAGAERIHGYTETEALGHHFSLLRAPSERDLERAEYELRRARAEGQYDGELWRGRKDGGSFWARVRITALQDDGGVLIGFAKVTQDLTERRAKSDFLAAMSQELRTPLNAIAGLVDLMEQGIQGPITEAQASALERIRRNQQLLLILINDILNYAKIDAGHMDLEISDVPIGAALTGVDSLIEPQARAADLTCTYSVDGGGPLCARCDRERLEQILLNLMTNAVKFNALGGSIHVAAVAAGADVHISVQDTGRGIPPDMLEKVFDPFVQIDRRRQLRNRQGVGLGLSISRELARQMGGDLKVSSVLDSGSTFTLVLPRAQDGAVHR